MKHPHRILIIALCPLIVVSGCKKKEAQTTSDTGTRKIGTPTVAAQPASHPAAQPAQAAATGSPAANADPGLTVDTTAKLEGAQWAMQQDAILHEANGQWAVTASASSTYNKADGHDDFAAWQATGAPNVEREGDDARAWTPKDQDSGIEWLDLTYTKPVNATSLRIRESAGAGALIKVELYDDQGKAHAIWQGVDPTKGLNYFMLNFPKTAYKTSRVRITLATNIIPGWNEIDAVQLVGTE